MDEGSLSLLSLSSLSSSPLPTEKESLLQSDSTNLQSKQEHKLTKESGGDDVVPAEDRLLSGEENITLITESMTVTSADQEKLLLLNRNTDLRRVNKELMKLNEDWDQVYRSATLGLQQRVEFLEQENSAIKQLNNRLLLKVDHEQSAREYYEQTLMQELKKNQDLHEYIRMLDSRMHHRDTDRGKQASLSVMIHSPESCPSADVPGGPIRASGQSSGLRPPACFSSSLSPEAGPRGWSQSSSAPSGTPGAATDGQREVQDLKEQLEALRCQTQIYEADYQTEHKDHKHTLQENRRLRKKREEMRQQVALLQEQLKVYEDDFRKERSDKQILQRLLLKKTHPSKDPVLVHRCNSEKQPPDGNKTSQSGERTQQHRKQHHPLCPKHCNSEDQEFP